VITRNVTGFKNRTVHIEDWGRKVNLMIIEEKPKYVKMSSQQARMYLQNLIIGDFKFSGDLMTLHIWDYL